LDQRAKRPVWLLPSLAIGVAPAAAVNRLPRETGSTRRWCSRQIPMAEAPFPARWQPSSRVRTARSGRSRWMKLWRVL